ncbi:hypothetical protein CFP56_011693 [Quercus suber]|uniref:Uncharacterized protein n=1 Tax=Quercus suber TaxID=58331 RepID=A0AAW0KZG2_QUESU
MSPCSSSLLCKARAQHSNLDLKLLLLLRRAFHFVKFSSASPSMADCRELQGSDLTAESRAVAGVRASDFGLH